MVVAVPDQLSSVVSVIVEEDCVKDERESRLAMEHRKQAANRRSGRGSRRATFQKATEL